MLRWDLTLKAWVILHLNESLWYNLSRPFGYLSFIECHRPYSLSICSILSWIGKYAVSFPSDLILIFIFSDEAVIFLGTAELGLWNIWLNDVDISLLRRSKSDWLCVYDVVNICDVLGWSLILQIKILLIDSVVINVRSLWCLCIHDTLFVCYGWNISLELQRLIS